jgi:hypothetical protein
MRARFVAWLAVIMGWERRRLRPRDPVAAAPAHLVMSPHVEFIRVYDEPGGYEKRLPYRGMLTVTWLNDKVVYLHGAVGKIDRAAHTQAVAMLRARGITTLMVERHGRMKTIDLSALAAPSTEQ